MHFLLKLLCFMNIRHKWHYCGLNNSVRYCERCRVTEIKNIVEVQKLKHIEHYTWIRTTLKVVWTRV